MNLDFKKNNIGQNILRRANLWSILCAVLICGASTKWLLDSFYVPVVRTFVFLNEDLLASGGGLVTSHDGKIVDGRICIWRIQTGELVQKLYSPDHNITWIRYIPENQSLIGCDSSVNCWKWNVYSGARQKIALPSNIITIGKNKFELPENESAGTSNFLLANLQRQIRQNSLQNREILSISQDEKLAVILRSGGVIEVWDINHAKKLHDVLIEDKFHPRNITLSVDGKLIAVGQDSNIQLWSTESRRIINKLPIPCDNVSTLALSIDNKKIATADFYGKIKLWNIQDGKEILSMDME